MRKKLQDKVFEASYYIELLISALIIIVIGVEIVKMISEITNFGHLWNDTSAISEFMNRALTLVVGVEFIKMLCKHSATAVIEVLLFATARHMVVEQMNMIETVIGVAAIAALFATRKYLLTKADIEHKTDSLE